MILFTYITEDIVVIIQMHHISMIFDPQYKLCLQYNAHFDTHGSFELTDLQ